MPIKEGSLNKATHVLHRMKVFTNWWTIVFPFTRIIKRKDRIMKLRKGGKIFLRSIFDSDFYVTMEIFDRDDYGLSRVVLPQNATIVDAGANIGAFTLFAAALFPDARIFSFEPEKGNYEVLKKNVELNALSNVTPYHEAVSVHDGTVKLSIDTKDNASHSIEGSLKNDAQEVSAVSLKTIIERDGLKNIDLLKLDIEGTEYEVLMGSGDILHMINRMVLEVHEHPKFSTTQLLEFLRTNGFDVVVSSTRSNVFHVTRHA